MRLQHVCLACRLRYGRQSVSAITKSAVERPLHSKSGHSIRRRSSTQAQPKPPRVVTPSDNIHAPVFHPLRWRPPQSQRSSKSTPGTRNLSVEAFDHLSAEQRIQIANLSQVKGKLVEIVNEDLTLTRQERATVTVPQALKSLHDRKSVAYHVLAANVDLDAIAKQYSTTMLDNFAYTIERIKRYKNPTTPNPVRDSRARDCLIDLGILSTVHDEGAAEGHVDLSAHSNIPGAVEFEPTPAEAPLAADYEKALEDQTKVSLEKRAQREDEDNYEPSTDMQGDRIADLNLISLQSMRAQDEPLTALSHGDVKVPGLSFDLSRVLFNPGVYHLQDPRSRIYNFDPYLEKVMPVNEFNFDALNQYITSSKDTYLRDLALQQGKRYIGSSSSMSGALTHFHFLLSAWRPLQFNNMSRAFSENSTSFTKFYKGPSAVFLRYQDGAYAVDADKEFDSANVLMSLGRSLEKLLTLEKDKFEQYRKTNDPDTLVSTDPESYHYGELGPFLMRSQLDAHDPRLPGTGMFDLKTRAVVAIRMSMSDHERGLGYQIKSRFGTWESYEREFYDMGRAAFLKYSLQVRMGRMDGIFVAYHNVERLFGFQYLPLPEMDAVLHGTTDRTLGDREFSLSVRLLGEIFDRATKRFPKQSIRFHFETREATEIREPVPYMMIFAEPMSEDAVNEIQTSKKEEIKTIEKQLMNAAQSPPPEDTGTSFSDASVADTLSPSPPTPSMSSPPDPPSTADTSFLDSLPSLLQTSSNPTPVLALKLVSRSQVNNTYYARPSDLRDSDEWTLEYNLTEYDDKKGHHLYTACKNRRATASVLAKQENEWENNGYMRALRSRSEEGRAWRNWRDEADKRMGEKRVLYPEMVK